MFRAIKRYLQSFISDQSTVPTVFREDEIPVSPFNATCAEVFPGLNHRSQAVMFTTPQVKFLKPVMK